MAHVAKINDEGLVVAVHVLDNGSLPDQGTFSPEVEAAANTFQHSLGLDGVWMLTSYNGNFRGRFAGIGYRYDKATDEFIPPGWEYIDGEWQDPNPPEPI